MKRIVILCFSLILVGILKVQCRKVKPDETHSTSRPPKTGWRKGNGVCVCDKGPIPTGHAGSHFTGHPNTHPTGLQGHHPTGHPSPRPSGHHGHHTTGHHRPSSSGHPRHHTTGHRRPRRSRRHGHHRNGHYSPRPSGHRSHHPTRQTTPRSSGHPSHHPTRQTTPRPSGHPSHHPTRRTAPRPSGHPSHHPTRRTAPRPSGHPSHHPSGHYSPYPTGNNPRPSKGHPDSKEGYTRCECGRKREYLYKLRWRMKMPWNNRLSDKNSEEYKTLTQTTSHKLKKVFKRMKRFTEIEFTEGSVVVKVGVVFEVFENGSIGEDPGKDLKNAILNGEMKDMGIYPDSLQVTQSFYGVQLSEWKSSLHDCIKGCRYPSQIVQRTRTCTEINGSCEGIPLTENSTCLEACPQKHAEKGKTKAQKVLVIVGICGGIVFILVAIVVVLRIKKSYKKYVKTSPSTTSIKELAKNDELQQEMQFTSKC